MGYSQPYSSNTNMSGVPLYGATSYDPTQDTIKSGLARTQAGFDFDNNMRMLRQQQQPELQKLQFEQGKWNTLLPYLQQSFAGQGRFSSTVGGQSGPGPRINAGPIWDQGKIQQADNAFRAQGDQQTASQVNNMRSRMAGSGYGANSPLAAALETQMGMSNRASTADQVRQFNQSAAEKNAGQELKGQTAQETQYSNRMAEDIARRKNLLGYQSSLLGMLGQFL